MELKLIKNGKGDNSVTLLIVLNGIEIEKDIDWKQFDETFNRTKWNWNSLPQTGDWVGKSFNRTKWNWNKYSAGGLTSHRMLLIVLNGIEIRKASQNEKPMCLLIVLNGIEITAEIKRKDIHWLLIVLNGIEMYMKV